MGLEKDGYNPQHSRFWTRVHRQAAHLCTDASEETGDAQKPEERFPHAACGQTRHLCARTSCQDRATPLGSTVHVAQRPNFEAKIKVVRKII